MVIADLEAGVGTLQRLLPDQADYAIVVAQPTAKSIEAARRAVELAEGKARVIVIANRVTSAGDVALIREGVAGQHELLAVPDDAAVARADEEGLAPFDEAPDAPAVRAITALAARLTAPPPSDP